MNTLNTAEAKQAMEYNRAICNNLKAMKTKTQIDKL
jgi:hypothetical protein